MDFTKKIKEVIQDNFPRAITEVRHDADNTYTVWVANEWRIELSEATKQLYFVLKNALRHHYIHIAAVIPETPEMMWQRMDMSNGLGVEDSDVFYHKAPDLTKYQGIVGVEKTDEWRTQWLCGVTSDDTMKIHGATQTYPKEVLDFMEVTTDEDIEVCLRNRVRKELFDFVKSELIHKASDDQAKMPHGVLSAFHYAYGFSYLPVRISDWELTSNEVETWANVAHPNIKSIQDALASLKAPI